MPLSDMFKRKPSQIVKPAAESVKLPPIDYSQIADAKRSFADEARSYYHGRNWELTELALRAHGTAFRCASLNARILASCPIRLYTTEKSGASIVRMAKQLGYYECKARRVSSRKKLNAIHNPGVVGYKAADYAETADDVVEITHHPILDLLRGPDPDTSGTMYQLAKYINLQLMGNSFGVFSRHKQSLSLTNLEAQFVTIEPGEDRLIDAYWYRRAENKAVQFQAEDIVHLKFLPSLSDPRWGVGPLHTVIAEMDIEDFAIIAEKDRWQQGGQPGGVVALEGANTNQMEAARSAFHAMYMGARNAAR